MSLICDHLIATADSLSVLDDHFVLSGEHRIGKNYFVVIVVLYS